MNDDIQNGPNRVSDNIPQSTPPTFTTVPNNQQTNNSATEPPLPDAIIEARDKVNKFYKTLSLIFAPICIVAVIIAILFLFIFNNPGSGN